MGVYYYIYGGVLMEGKLFYYSSSSDLLSYKEPIYLNKAFEPVESHLHAHDFIEIAYVVSGIGTHCIGENEYNVSKGDLFIINYNIPHEFRSHEDLNKPRLWVYNCIFEPEFLDYKLVNSRDFHNITQHFLFRSVFPEEATFNDDIKLQGKESQEIEELYEKMYREFMLKDEGYIEILRAYVIELLITIFRLYKKTDVLNDKLETHRQEIMNRVIRYMKDNYTKELKLEEISTIAFLSPNYFSKLFKECTSMTVSEYMQKIRIEEACRLLKSTERKVIDIAFEVGYRDIKYFNQIFKRISGRTPGDYRKTLK
jgi:AraC family L-rhamnose operon transcriptional activator RhaR